MKKLFILALACAACAGVSAQSIYYQDSSNEDMLRHTDYQDVLRQEFIIPNVNGYKVLKSDLHAHTIFSDGALPQSIACVKPGWMAWMYWPSPSISSIALTRV